MTTEGAATVGATPATDDGRLFCYRHPDRETYVRCGRCDRPICPRCAMQGPVGFRCKKCGTLANDPLTTFRPTQVVLGLGIAVGGGIVVGLISAALGFFTIFIGFIGGGFIAEGVLRVIGIKRGTTIVAIVLGGIIAGALAGAVLSVAFLTGQLTGIPSEGTAFSIGALITSELPWLLISAGAACVGAYSRLR